MTPFRLRLPRLARNDTFQVEINWLLKVRKILDLVVRLNENPYLDVF